MEMRKNIQDIYKVLTTDETLLRLLYYPAINPLDSPLSPSKQNILEMPDEEKWAIILDRIMTTPKVDDLVDDKPKCRLLFYAGDRNVTKNYLVADQEFVFDVICHLNFDEVDQRLTWICDTINDLLFNKRITGVGKVEFKSGRPIGAPNGYIGYRLRYLFGSENYV